LDKYALAWRDQLSGPHNVDGVLQLAATDRAEEIESELGEDAAQRFASLVFGKSIPIDLALSSYLAEHTTGKTDQEAKRYAVELLKRGTRATMVDQVTRRVAGHFVSWLATEAPQEGNGRPREPRAAATCNKYSHDYTASGSILRDVA
jgi:hypothetical protein